MKRLRGLLPFLLVSAMILPVAGCGFDKGKTGESGSSATAAATAPEGTDNHAGASALTIGGRPLSDFTIVYAPTDSSFRRQTSRNNALAHGQENDFNKVTAERIQKELSRRFGVTLEINTDVSGKQGCEILVGDTKREADDAFVTADTDRYTVAMSGDSLCFIGGAYGTTYHSVDYFLSYLDQAAGDTDIPAGFKLEGRHHLTVIGCIGDSITEGVGSSNSAVYSYPEAMNRILWKDCVVINYGVSGMTMRNDTNAAYMSTGKYSQALRNASNVDVFTIMLGTNDSRGDIVSAYGKNQEQFEKGFSDLLAALHKRGRSARFILMNCPVYYGNETFGADYIVEWQSRLYEKYKDRYDLSFFDMRTFSEENMPVGCFGDRLHPNDAGYVIMAEGVANMLKEYLGIS